MRKLKLGNEIETSCIGLGCMRQCRVDKKIAEANFYAAIDSGITMFDHADVYGMGASESLYGEFIAADPGVREKIQLQTKCALIRDTEKTLYIDTGKEHILNSVDNSLKRLHTDYLDGFLLHSADALMEPDEIAEAFDELYKSGKVRYFGVSNFNRADFEYLQSCLDHKLVLNQLQLSAAHTDLIDSTNSIRMRYEVDMDHNGGMLIYARQNNVTIQAWSSLQAGFYGGVFMKHPDFPLLNEAVDRIAGQYGVSSAAIGIAWILRHPANIQPLLGTTNPEHLKDMARAAQINLSREEWYEIYRASLTDTGKFLSGNSNHQK